VCVCVCVWCAFARFSTNLKVCVTEGSEEASEKELEFVTQIQKMILTKLGLHGRVLELPTEDMGGMLDMDAGSEVEMELVEE